MFQSVPSAHFQLGSGSTFLHVTTFSGVVIQGAKKKKTDASSCFQATTSREINMLAWKASFFLFGRENSFLDFLHSSTNLRIEARERTSAENLFIMCINLIVTETEWMCILPISAVITVIYDARSFFATNERKRENAPCRKSVVGGRWKSVEDKNGARLRCASISTKSVCLWGSEFCFLPFFTPSRSRNKTKRAEISALGKKNGSDLCGAVGAFKGSEER